MKMTRKKRFAIAAAVIASGAVVFVGVNVYASTHPTCPTGATKQNGALGITVCVQKVEHLTLAIKAQ